MKTLTEQIECARREIGFRRRVYHRRVANGSMKQVQADHEIACMEGILATLIRLSEQDFTLG